MDWIYTCHIAGFDLITEIRICLFYYKFSCKTRIKIPQSSWLIPHVTWAFSKLLVDKTQNNYTPHKLAYDLEHRQSEKWHEIFTNVTLFQNQYNIKDTDNPSTLPPNDSPEPPFFPEATKKKIPKTSKTSYQMTQIPSINASNPFPAAKNAWAPLWEFWSMQHNFCSILMAGTHLECQTNELLALCKRDTPTNIQNEASWIWRYPNEVNRVRAKPTYPIL